MHALSQLDLVFCVDLTGSMGGLITAAKQDMARVLEALRGALGDGLRVAIVGYRDHCDGAKLLEVHPLDGDVARVARRIAGLAVSGGGDAPEAVYSGLQACLRLSWGAGSYRVILLVGDAPPHGVGMAGDSFPNGDPTKLGLDDMANLLEAEGVFVHALALQPGNPILVSSFRRLSIATGGSYHDTSSSNAAMKLVEAVTRGLLGDLDFDRRLLGRLREAMPPEPADDFAPSKYEVLARDFRVEPQAIHTALMRLRRRRLLDGIDI